MKHLLFALSLVSCGGINIGGNKGSSDSGSTDPDAPNGAEVVRIDQVITCEDKIITIGLAPTYNMGEPHAILAVARAEGAQAPDKCTAENATITVGDGSKKTLPYWSVSFEEKPETTVSFRACAFNAKANTYSVGVTKTVTMPKCAF